MDHSRYWLWSRTKLGGMPRLPPLPAIDGRNAPFHDSWEEQAFAEDTARHLGGCVWPPRSYSCSFCKREFRSAQALGGHMNVHRRDRARLRLSSPSNAVENGHIHSNLEEDHPSHNPCIALPAAQSSLSYNTHKTDTEPDAPAAAPPLSPSRVAFASGTHKSNSEHTLVSLASCSSPLEKEEQKRSHFSVTRLQDSVPCSLQMLTVVPEPKQLGIEASLKIKQISELMKGGDSWIEEEVALRDMKKSRIDVASTAIGPGNSSSGGSIQCEVLLGVGHTPIEELDLELRLGNRPKVK